MKLHVSHRSKLKELTFFWCHDYRPFVVVRYNLYSVLYKFTNTGRT